MLYGLAAASWSSPLLDLYFGVLVEPTTQIPFLREAIYSSHPSLLPSGLLARPVVPIQGRFQTSRRTFSTSRPTHYRSSTTFYNLDVALIVRVSQRLTRNANSPTVGKTTTYKYLDANGNPTGDVITTIVVPDDARGVTKAPTSRASQIAITGKSRRAFAATA